MLEYSPKMQIPSKIQDLICILGEHSSMEMERKWMHSIELVEFYRDPPYSMFGKNSSGRYA